VLAEIQQRSDTTFRLFDYGRERELHIDNGVAVANVFPLGPPRQPTSLTPERTVLVSSRHFVLERLELPEASNWALLADSETWILALDGHAEIGSTVLSIGQAIFVGGGRVNIEVGAGGLTVLVAYPASAPIGSLLHRLSGQSARPVQPVAADLAKLTGLAEAHS
jgi:mannose-6-phosphate isomerase